MLARHDEQLANHPRPLSNILLHQLGTRHADEAAVGMMRDGTREESLAGTGGAIEENALGLCDTEALENLGVLDRKLDNLLDFLNLLLQTTNGLVRRVWNLLDTHEGDEGVYLAR